MNLNATIIGQSIAFAVFVWFCMKYVWPPIMEALETRKKGIADGLAAAARGNQELEKAQLKIARQLQEARGQAQEIIDLANRRASQIVDEAKDQARQDADRIRTTAQSDIDAGNEPCQGSSQVSSCRACRCWCRTNSWCQSGRVRKQSIG